MHFSSVFQLVILLSLVSLRLRLLSSSSRITPPLLLRLLVLLAPPLAFLANHSLLLPKHLLSTHPEPSRLKTTHPRPLSSPQTTACLQPRRPQPVTNPVPDTPHHQVPPLRLGVPIPMPETARLTARATPSQVLAIGKSPLTSPQHLAITSLCLQHINPPQICV